MSNMPEVKPGDWISFPSGLHAVICNVRSPEHREHSGDAEIVYLDYRDRAINTNVRWTETGWTFLDQVDGGYADKYQRLREYVQILRRGRYRS